MSNELQQQCSTSNEGQKLLDEFWAGVMNDVQNVKDSDFKSQELPLARIKKIMKLDEDVGLMVRLIFKLKWLMIVRDNQLSLTIIFTFQQMISSEAPVLFAKAAEIFINELTLRAWIHTEENKRRTLQRNDIAMAISKYDMFDFLIDIVPRT